MKKIFFTLLLVITFSFTAEAQRNKKMDTNTHVTEMQDKLALKELVDVFSMLADQKEVEKQTFLFTEDATVESFMNGKSTGVLTGRKQIGDAFAGFLQLFDVVYHINGQQVLTLNGDNATGTSYCLVTLIGNENGKKMKNTMGVIYHDTYVKKSGKWFIAKRQSNFTWTEKTEMK
ncbi:MAG: nuclear transport factor 2 family protein [Paludibacter sp.]|nr:nuclear transport factor 2 family protein [Paludibacter sp.]MBP7612471.1 nuclear transport factor 2 family protein [Paludibacter sp.]